MPTRPLWTAMVLLLVSLSLAWDSPTDPTGVTSYRLCTGTAVGQETTCVDVGLVLQATISVPDNAETFVVVLSFDGTNVSAPSNEVCGFGAVDCAASGISSMQRGSQ